MLDNLLDNNDLVFVQEHWLLPSNIHLLTTNCSGFAISGCYDIEKFANAGGRPYGGVGVLWKQSPNFTCTLLGFNDTHRCLAVKVQGISFVYICINVYLPTFCNNDSYEEEILNCFAFIDSVLEEHASNVNMHVVLLGDFNFDIYRLNNCARLGIVQNFLREYGLSVCDHLDCNKLGYSYRHEGLNCQSLIDHVFVSPGLVNNVHNYALLDSGLNFSDHCAVCFNISSTIGINGQSQVFCNNSCGKRAFLPSYVWNEHSIANYQRFIARNLCPLQGYLDEFKCSFPCNHSEHKVALCTFCDNLASCVKSAAENSVEAKSPGIKKPYWSSELSDLKRLSIEAHVNWEANGRPKSGFANDNRLMCKYRYKRAIRVARYNFEHNLSNKLADKLLKGDSRSFWSIWNAEFGNSKFVNASIGGICDDAKIAQGFADSFSNNFYDSASNDKLMKRFLSAYEHYAGNHSNDCLLFTLNDVKQAISTLKLGKSPGFDGIMPEMIYYAGNHLADIMMKLFNLCLVHGYVPDSFCHSVIVPVVKEKNGNNDSFDNYRPISLVTMFSKVFELCISQHLEWLFKVDELQFGFVSGMGCQKALFSLETVTNYFTKRGSPVFMAALDASKAFDRVNHFELLYKLIHIGVPLCLINVFLCWFLKLNGEVIWNGMFSSVFFMKSGVGQGRINSPWFFNVYINDLIVNLRNSGFGCYIGCLYAGCLFFADDILLLSASILHLQCMLKLCGDYGNDNDILFNQKKSFLLQVGLDTNVVLPQLVLNNVFLQWVDRIKYLGVYIIAGKSFSVESSYNRTKFLSAVFGILQKCRNVSEEIKFNIIQHSCIEILLYGIDSLSLKPCHVHKLSVAYNIAVRRCFNFSRSTSVRNVLFFMNCLPIGLTMDLRKMLLLKSCIESTSELVRLCGLIRYNDDNILDMFFKYDVHCNMSRPRIKSCVKCKFVDILRAEGLV
jgi:exonuclease III